MIETSEEQRTRILGDNLDTSSRDYDSALLLGYRAESWDGMWKLPLRHPILWISNNWAIVAEVVQGNNHVGIRNWRGKVKVRYRFKKAIND